MKRGRKGRDQVPPPGLDGTYRGSCVICLRGCDTGLGLWGEAEVIIAGLRRLGIPEEDATAMVTLATGCEPGKVPIGAFGTEVRVCEDCVAKSGTGMRVGLIATGERPIYTHRPEA